MHFNKIASVPLNAQQGALLRFGKCAHMHAQMWHIYYERHKKDHWAFFLWWPGSHCRKCSNKSPGNESVKSQLWCDGIMDQCRRRSCSLKQKSTKHSMHVEIYFICKEASEWVQHVHLLEFIHLPTSNDFNFIAPKWENQWTICKRLISLSGVQWFQYSWTKSSSFYVSETTRCAYAWAEAEGLSVRSTS